MWCFCGDFNAIRGRVERQGADRGHFTREMKEFNGFIETNLFLDLPIVGKNLLGSNQMERQRVGLIELL